MSPINAIVGHKWTLLAVMDLFTATNREKRVETGLPDVLYDRRNWFKIYSSISLRAATQLIVQHIGPKLSQI